MRLHIHAALAAACLLSSTHAAQAAQPLLASSPHDLLPKRLVSLPAPAGAIERAPVGFSWALDPSSPALDQPEEFVAESREYWQTVDGTELQDGVQFKTSAPGAVIRISPARGAAPIESRSIGVTGNGRSARVETAADATALQAAGMDVNAGTAIVKLARENGAGTYALRAANARGRYIVHVFEPESNVVLKARTDRSHVLGGDTIQLAMELTDAGRPLAVQAQALLVAPDGDGRPVPVTRAADGTLSARVKLPTQASSAPGLWELQVFASGDGVSRDARTAFGVAAPTARLRGEASVDASALRIVVPIENASPGRYEVRGTLYATASDGSMAPVSQAHSAAWFERGNGSLVLAFDRNHVPSGYGAPFEVRNLELHDQGRLAPLERRGRALRF